MPDILDELEGILGADAIGKLRAAPIAQRLQRGDSVREYYDGNMEGDPPPPRERQQQRQEPGSGGGESLADVLGELGKITTRLGTLDATVATKVNEVVEKRGSELFNNAVGMAMNNTLDLLDITARHRENFGEPLDRVKLEAHATAAREAGRPFRTVTEAWEDMTREDRLEKRIATGVETGIREKLKTINNGSLPGVSGTSGSPMLRALKAVPSGGGNTSAVSKAARGLEDLLASRGEAVA